jgi:anti-sigma factor RsiW
MTESRNTECREILERISGYLDGDLDATKCEVIERHSVDCAACAALVKGLRETVGLCRQTAAVPLPESVRRRAQESVRQLLDRDRRGD